MVNIVQSNNSFRFYGDAVKVHNTLPPATYTINFDPMSGFSLEKSSNIGVQEKAYGSIDSRVNKVFKQYESSGRSLGVMMTGPKGMGKSMLLRSIAQRGVELGYATVIVDRFYDGLAGFLDSLGEVILVFDEFEKVFDEQEQSVLLPMFDGLSMQKRMCIVTVNETNHLSQYLINRPGRFHYNFTFTYPSESEIREFLTDHAVDADNINRVVAYSVFREINYDHLRAIANELVTFDVSFDDAFADLNIGSGPVKMLVDGTVGGIEFNSTGYVNPSDIENEINLRGSDGTHTTWYELGIDLSSARIVGSSVIVNRTSVNGGMWTDDEIRLSKPSVDASIRNAF